jgi:uncharacterized membrane protein YcfT
MAMLQNSTSVNLPSGRIPWVDVAKGICIILVVMMHSTLGVYDRLGAGFMDWPVAFAKPFRMPDFFLLSGLFLAATINRPRDLYFDRKVVHFAYFYVLWFAIQMGLKMPVHIGEFGFAGALQQAALDFVNPHSTLWFIYMLPVFFLLCRALRSVPHVVVFALAAIAHILPVNTGVVLIDQTATQFVYFFAGYAFAPLIFRVAEWAIENVAKAAGVLMAWLVLHSFMVFMPTPGFLAGFADVLARLPVLTIVTGFAGAGAIILVSALLTKNLAWDWPSKIPPRPLTRFLQHTGANSIAVYLAFFFPMGVTRSILIRFAPEMGAGTIALVVTSVAVISPLILLWFIQKLNVGHFLFRRPAWAITAWKPGEKEKMRQGRSSEPQIAPAE